MKCCLNEHQDNFLSITILFKILRPIALESRSLGGRHHIEIVDIYESWWISNLNLYELLWVFQIQDGGSVYKIYHRIYLNLFESYWIWMSFESGLHLLGRSVFLEQTKNWKNWNVQQPQRCESLVSLCSSHRQQIEMCARIFVCVFVVLRRYFWYFVVITIPMYSIHILFVIFK